MIDLMKTGRTINLNKVVLSEENEYITILSDNNGKKLIKFNIMKDRTKGKYYLEKKRHKKFKNFLVFDEYVEKEPTSEEI